MPPRPNIVLVLADDMGYGDIGAFGNPDVQTPNLDRLAREGTRLTQHYSGSPMCAPARAALLTGRYPHRTGAVDVVECRGLDRIALRERTIADLLRAAGYATGIFGKWHNGAVDPRYHPCARGFDEFVGFRGGLVASYWDYVIESHGSFQPSDGRYLTDAFTDEAMSFIGRRRNEPFFLYVPYNAPHTPLQAPPEDIEPFARAGRFTQAVSTIYGMNRRMDAGIGRILEALDTHGLTENTLFVFTSDNGPMFTGTGQGDSTRFNGHFNGSKGSVLEGGIRVPAIVRWPGAIPGGREVGEMVHFTDWLPTLLSAAGASLPDDLALDGCDMLPVLSGRSAKARQRCFWQWNRYTPVPNCNAAMRDGPWKLYRAAIPEALAKLPEDNLRTREIVADPQQANRVWFEKIERELSWPREAMLFNLDDDPYETTDLSAEHAERLGRMQRELETWFESVEADRAAIPDEHVRWSLPQDEE